MKAVITVIGIDKVGIIALVSRILAENHVNILDLSQTIMDNKFTMIMSVDFTKESSSLEDVRDRLEIEGKKMQLVIQIYNEEIFETMHRI